MSIHHQRALAVLVTTLGLLVVALGSNNISAQSALLDGKTFVADAGVKGKPADEKDDIISFKDGKFHSSSCDQWGYGKGDFKASTTNDGISFETETFSEKYGKLAWKGIIRGDSIEGAFIQYPKPGFFNSNPAPIEHWYKGKLKQK